MSDRKLFTYHATVLDPASGQQRTVKVLSYWSPAKDYVFELIARTAAAIETHSTRGAQKFVGINAVVAA